MRLRKIAASVITACTILGLGACNLGKMEENEVEVSYLDTLEDGTFYVRHKGDVCEPVYVGETTFKENSIPSGISTDRICWFKENFENIPALHKGEHLILYTENVLEESFTFERFCDIGYTIGLRIPNITGTGRFKISTDVDMCLTYPDGDTDEINDMPNTTIIMETMGGQKLRAEKVLDAEYDDSIFYSIENNYSAKNYLSDYGTILNLNQGESYEAEIYNGTVLSEFIFKADVRVLGCMEIVTNNDYEFESGKIILIKIPEWFESGYYMINGQGLFRYEKDAAYDEFSQTYTAVTTDYNIPNIPPELEENNFYNMDDALPSENNTNNERKEESNEEDFSIGEYISDLDIPDLKEEQQDFDYICMVYDTENNEYITSMTALQSSGNDFNFDIPVSGKVKVSVYFIGHDEEEMLINAVIKTPSSESFAVANEADHLEYYFENAEIGTYTLNFYDLGNYIPEITVREMPETEEGTYGE